MRARRIEIAQDGDPPVGIGARQVAQEILDDALGAAVDALRRERRVLVHRERVGLPIDGRRRAVDQRGDARLAHHLGERERAAHVDAVIRERAHLRFPDRLQSGAMDHAGDRAIVKRPAQRVDIADVGFDARHLGAGQRRKARQHGTRARGEVVEHEGGVARFGELDDDVRADVTCASGNEDGVAHATMLPYRSASRCGGAKKPKAGQTARPLVIDDSSATADPFGLLRRRSSCLRQAPPPAGDRRARPAPSALYRRRGIRT